MNYYDYRTYFNSIENDLDNIYSQQGEIITEIRDIHTDTNNKLDKIDQTLTSGITLISALIVVSAAMKVIFGR